MAQIQLKLMKKDVDYGLIPGTGDKPTLLKPGSETLLQFYGLVPTFESILERGDGATAPRIRYHVKCRLHLGSADGPVVGSGEGAANSSERKYRYRTAELTCPKCGVMGTVTKSKRSGWFCWAKKGGCGAEFPDGDPSIEKQERGKVINPDPDDADNTLLKMAEKRAQIDATLRTTATSGLFTQDVEDMAEFAGAATAATEQSSNGRQVATETRAEAAPAPPMPTIDGMPEEIARSLAFVAQTVHGTPELNWPEKTKAINLTSALKLLDARGGIKDTGARVLLCAMQWSIDGESHSTETIADELDVRLLPLISGHVERFKEFAAVAEWWRLNRCGE